MNVVSGSDGLNVLVHLLFVEVMMETSTQSQRHLYDFTFSSMMQKEKKLFIHANYGAFKMKKISKMNRLRQKKTD